MNFKKHIFTILLIIGTAIISLILLYIINISIEIILPIDAIFITIFIAITQEDQLKKLEDIGNQTKETTKKLKTDSSIREIVEKFFIFKAKGKNKQKINVFFPVEYESRPLPLINQGDFYAIHVLTTRLGEDNLNLIRVPKTKKFTDRRLLEGSNVFICAPPANRALNNVFGFKQFKIESDKKELEKWPLDELSLPCWFVEDHLHPEHPEIRWPIRKIKVYDGENVIDLLTSDAEDCYKKASELPKGNEFLCTTPIQRDYGIFARINKNGNQYIIISGLHQYGTWIVATFLSNLLSDDKTIDHRSTFLDSKDFIAIITGEYDNEKLSVNGKSIGVHNKYIWTKEKENDTWSREY